MACCVRSFSFSCVRLIIIQIYCCYKDNLITGSDVPSLLHGFSRIIIRLIVYNLFFDLQHFMNSGSCFVCGHFSFKFRFTSAISDLLTAVFKAFGVLVTIVVFLLFEDGLQYWKFVLVWSVQKH